MTDFSFLRNAPVISEAYNLGVVSHYGQVRKYTGLPYFQDHCVNVARLVHAAGGDDQQIAAALLHDVLEDTRTSEASMRRIVGDDVTDLVLELTDEFTKDKYPDLNRRQRKDREIGRLGGISSRAKLIKRCDLVNNTASILRHDPEFAKVYLVEIAKTLEAMGF